MVFAPKKAAQDIGWGSRRVKAKSNNETTTNKIIAPKHELKEQFLPTTKTSSLKRRERSSNEATSSILNRSCTPEESTQKRKKESEFECDKLFHYEINEARVKLPLKGRTLPDVELDTKKTNNVLSTIVTIQVSTTFAFTGRAKVIAHEGSVEIFGYKLKSTCSPERRTIIIDCPSWMNSLCISHGQSATKSKSSSSKIEFVSMEHDKFTYEFMNFDEARSAIVIDERWKNTTQQVIEDFNSTKLRNQIGTKEEANICSNRVLVCGAKNVGKSTFAKYITNCFLSTPNIDRIAFMDCDVGQPELGLPGNLSLTILTKPLLCPPHVHLICHEDEENDVQSFGAASSHHVAYYYGSTSPKVNPLLFSNGVRQLMDDYITLCKKESIFIPLIVNTDGWVKGMGFEILSSTIETIKPGHVVQILGSTKAKYFDITAHSMSSRTIHVLYSSNVSSRQDESSAVAADSNPNINAISPSLLRNLRLCTYFLGGYKYFLQTNAILQQSSIVDDDCSIATALSRQKPYMVPFGAVTCTILDDGGNHEFFSFNRDRNYPDFLLDVLNGSVVGLCRDSKQNCKTEMNKIHSCVGFGIVRSIDRTKRLFYILSPVPASILQNQITHIVLGQIQLPFECTFLGPNSEAFPYHTCDKGI